MLIANKINTRERSKEKIDTVIELLAKFDFSTVSLMCDFLNVDFKGQAVFFKDLLNKKILKRYKINGMNKYIYTLDTMGKNLAKLKYPNIKIKEHRLNPSLVALSHSFCIQYIVAQYLKDNLNITYQSEKQFMHLNLQRRPDAIIEIENLKYAIEIEITKKPMQKIYYNYAGHIRNFRGGIYNKVIYIFNNQYTLDYYKNLHNESNWPIFDKSKISGKLELRRNTSFDSSLIADLSIFDFKFNEMYRI